MKLKSMDEKKKERLGKGELLPVMEHFYTLQGEGAHTGKAAYFIRLGGCDVGCHWCDVKESWDAEQHTLMEIDEIAKLAIAESKTIVITGGEPLMWDLSKLTHKLKSLGAKIHIETSGAYSLSGEIDWVCLSPKKTSLPKEDVYKAASELKMIIYNLHDFQFAEEQAAKVNPNCELYLQSEWSKRDKMTPLIVDYVKNNPKWKISVQTHKYLNIP